MPAHRINAPFKDKDVLVIVRSMKKEGAQKSLVAKELRRRGFKRMPERSVDRALLRLKEAGEIKSAKRRWFPK